MRIVLVGANAEENLGLGLIGAAAQTAGHAVEVVTFDNDDDARRVATEVASAEPDVVGLGIQFQHRAQDYLVLAGRLRAAGFRGHLTCGGQFPTAAYAEVLAHNASVDSVVMHEGEQTIVDLLAALQEGRPLHEIDGLALRGEHDSIVRTPGRCLGDLDELPIAMRYRPHDEHLGLPFIPISGGRGCWGRCSYCSITSFYRDAQSQGGGGKRLRHRSPESIAREMALLWHSAGGESIFCFHDDNFLLPRPADTLARLRALRQHLDRYQVGKVALVGKCRPDSITPELARELHELGVVRLYVGVENTSQHGSDDLRRMVDVEQVQVALQACREAGIFVCYNLLLFEPDARLEDVAQNIAFMRRNAQSPVNFCRAEPYYGTPLAESLAARGALTGSYLGFDYRIADDRAELLFRISAAAFRERNFASAGVHNRYMGLGYCGALLRHFYGDEPRVEGLMAEAEALTRDIVLESADFLEEALEIVTEIDLSDHERLIRETAHLGMRIAEADRFHHARLDTLYGAMEALTEQETPSRSARYSRLREAVAQLARGVAFGALLTGFVAQTSGCDDQLPVPADAGAQDGNADMMVVDMVPPDGWIVDPPPPDGMVVDPLPADGMIGDPLPPDGMIVDPPPPDSMVVDMVPPDMGHDFGPVDPLPADAGAALSPELGDQRLAARSAGGAFVDTAPRRALRTADLPFFDPPRPRLRRSALAEGEGIVIALEGIDEAASLRWESDGLVEGEGMEVRWHPESEQDQLRLAVRTRGGVAVVTLRAGRV